MTKERPNFPEKARSLDEIKAEVQPLLDKLTSESEVGVEEKTAARTSLEKLHRDLHSLRFQTKNDSPEVEAINELADKIEGALSS